MLFMRSARLGAEALNLLTAIAIYFGEVPDLYGRMQEAAETLKYEEIRSDSMLSQECVKALRKMKIKNGKQRFKFNKLK